jgi:DNA-binding transcriptional LysR family regulator
MELRHLRYFVAVAELGSVSRAAEKLFIAQPPLSTQIRQLEDEVGVPLLVRYPRGVRTTSAGKVFLNEAKEVLARAENARQRARQHDRGGFLRLAYVPSAGHTVLPRLLPRLKQAHPHAELEVVEMITAQQLAALQADRIDVGYARLPAGAPENLALIELSDPFCLAIPEGHPLRAKGSIALRAASGAIFVSYTRYGGPAYYDQMIGLCMEAGFSPDIRYEASTLFGVLDLVSAGLGVALVPASSVLLVPKPVMLRALTRPSRTGALGCVSRKQDPNPLVTAIASLTNTVFADLRSEIRRDVVGL